MNRLEERIISSILKKAQREINAVDSSIIICIKERKSDRGNLNPSNRNDLTIFDEDARNDVLFACEFFNVSVEEFLSSNRRRDLSDLRKVLSYYLYEEYAHLGFEHIGKILNRDHATIMFCRKQCKLLAESDKLFRDKYIAFTKAINKRTSSKYENKKTN